MKRLIAAISRMRARLAVVEACLEEGDRERALVELDAATAEWQQALEEIRAA